jgi:hypothetical protein
MRLSHLLIGTSLRNLTFRHRNQGQLCTAKYSDKMQTATTDNQRGDLMFRIALAAAALLLIAANAATGQAVGHRVNVDGMRMYYEVTGAGDPLIVLHGAYMNIPSMGAIIPKLGKTHRVYALELQGHGRTTDIDRPITYPNLADDVAAFMDAVGLKKADVFGYSMGAAVGLKLTASWSI